MANRLNVIIPYYKRRFFRKAIESLANQTCKDFEVIVGDDASPEDPTSILKEFEASLKIKHVRFQTNMGGVMLPRHWSRCVLETNSDWVWLFSDDDIASPDCVESFYKELEQDQKFDLYRFEKGIIDDDGTEVVHSFPAPVTESAEELVLSRFDERRLTTAPEHIFSRSAFNRESGFVEFPLAWCADDASWAAFSKLTGVKTISGGRVQWRNGQCNISVLDRNLPLKMRAWRLYLKWLRTNFKDPEFHAKLANSSRKWFPTAFGNSAPLGSLLQFWCSYTRFTGCLELRMLLRLLRVNRHLPF